MTPLPAEYVHVIPRMAKEILRGLKGRSTLQLDDLVSAGWVGYFDAKSRYNPALGEATFSTFAYNRIRGEMFDEVRRCSTHKRKFSAEQKMVHLAAEQLTKEFGRAPEREEIARATDMSIERVDAVTAIRVFSLDPHSEEWRRMPDDGTVLGEDEFIESLDEPAREEAWENALRCMSPLEQNLVKGFFFEDKSIDALGKEFGFSKSWLSRMMRRTLDKLGRLYQTGAKPTPAELSTAETSAHHLLALCDAADEALAAAYCKAIRI